MGVEGGTSGGGVLLRGQQFLQLGIFLAPAFFDVFETFTAGLIPNVEVSYEEE